MLEIFSKNVYAEVLVMKGNVYDSFKKRAYKPKYIKSIEEINKIKPNAVFTSFIEE